MAVTAIATQDKDELYKEVERLIYWTVHKFINRYGGDFEEFLGEANWIFSELTSPNSKHYYPNRPNPKNGKFTNWLQFSIYTTLLEKQRESLRKQKLSKIVSLDPVEDIWEPLENLPEHKDKFMLSEFIEELSEDARIVAMLALDTPVGLTRIMVNKGGTGTQRRTVLRSYLKELGWTAARITESFYEIREMLGLFSC